VHPARRAYGRRPALTAWSKLTTAEGRRRLIGGALGAGTGALVGSAVSGGSGGRAVAGAVIGGGAGADWQPGDASATLRALGLGPSGQPRLRRVALIGKRRARTPVR
jgi:hypothetical protein